MIEKGGHYCRYYNTPAATPPKPTWLDKLRSLMFWTFYPGIKEGRRRVIPGMPYDHHALGWSDPVYPPGYPYGIKKSR